MIRLSSYTLRFVSVVCKFLDVERDLFVFFYEFFFVRDRIRFVVCFCVCCRVDSKGECEIDWFWLRGWLNNKGALCFLILEFWYKLLISSGSSSLRIRKTTNKISMKTREQNQSILYTYMYIDVYIHICIYIHMNVCIFMYIYT